MRHDKFSLPSLTSSAVRFSGPFVPVQSSLQYFGLQQYSKTHGCLEGLPSTPLIHNVDLLCAFSYLIWLTQCGLVLLSSSKEPMLSLSPGCRNALGSTDKEGKGQRESQRANQCLRTFHKVATVTTLGSPWLLPYIFVSNRHKGLRLSVALVCYSDVWLWVFCLSRRVNDKMCSLFVFVWFVFCRSLASLSSSLLFDPVHTFVLSP